MAYLGNVPARSFISFERQVFTIVNSQTAYTLSHSVTNENDIRLVVNNVVQEPGSGKAYTATGTALTLSAALTNGTDEMYCVFLGRAVETVKPPAGSVSTSQLADDAVTTAKILNSNITVGKMAANSVDSDQYVDASIDAAHLNSNTITGQTAETSIATDDLILLSDTSASGALKKMTRANFVSGVGGTNTPAFQASLTNSLSISDGTTTDIVFNSELYDVGSCYNNSTGVFTVPSGEAGKYLFGVNVLFTDGNGNVSDMLLYAHTTISSSGDQSQIARAESTSNGTTFTQRNLGMTFTLNLSVGDVVKIQAYADTNNGSATGVGTGGTPGKTIFYGYKIIE